MPGTNVPVANTNQALTSDAQTALSGILRAKNIHEFKSILVYGGMLQWPNGVPIESGTTIMIANKGLFNGKWIIQLVKFAIIGGRFVTEVELRKCILGTPTVTAAPPEEGPPKEPSPLAPAHPTVPTESPAPPTAYSGQTPSYSAFSVSRNEWDLQMPDGTKFHLPLDSYKGEGPLP